MALEIRDDINSIVDMINQIEWLRKQTQDLQALLKEDESAETMLAATEELERTLIDMQDNFYNVRLTYNSAQRWRERFYTRYCHLIASVGASDLPPTTQHVEVHEMFKERLASFRGQYNELFGKALLDFNNLAEEKTIPRIMRTRE